MTTEQTLTIHYFGVLGRSGSSGKYESIRGLVEMNSMIRSSVRFLY